MAADDKSALPNSSERPLALPGGSREVAGSSSSWQTTPDTIADASLSDIVAELAEIPSGWDEDQAARIGVRLAPYGFRVLMGELAHEHRISYSRLTRFALHHGMAILDASATVAALKTEFRRTTHAAMSAGDRDALTRLNQTGSYEFQHPQHDRTTLTVSRETLARLEDLARVCGIAASRLGVVAILVSLVTLRDARQYLQAIREEVAAFYRFVRVRKRILSVGSEPNHESHMRRSVIAPSRREDSDAFD